MFPNTNSHGRRWHMPDGSNLDALIRIGLVVSFAFFTVSHLPLPLVAPALRAFFLLAAIVSAAVAVCRLEQPHDTRLTHWDEAAAFTAGGLLAGLFIDPLAIEALQADVSTTPDHHDIADSRRAT
ncbi:MAG: hypothetical protein RIC16_05595 [Rhodospirillales bacterium]